MYILKVIFKSNSLSINKKNHINIKCSLLNKTLHSIRNILHKTVKKTYQVLSNDYNFFRPWKWNTILRNHLPCPRILKMICWNNWFNPLDVCMFVSIWWVCANKWISLFIPIISPSSFVNTYGNKQTKEIFFHRLFAPFLSLKIKQKASFSRNIS